MPLFEVKGQDGKTYEVDAPDAQTAAEAVGGAKQPEDAPVTLGGLGRAGAAGVGKGVVGLAGLPGDIRELINNQVGPWLEQNTPLKFGEPDPPIEGIPNIFQTTPELLAKANDAIRPAPSLSQLVTGEKPKTFMEYEPQNRSERFAETAGEFAPGMLAGPGGIATKTATTLGAAGLSEGAGQALEGTAFETPARIGGAVLGTLAGHRLTVRPTETDLIRRAVPNDFTAYRNLGPEARVLDASPGLVGLAQGATVAPGTAKNQIVQTLVERDAGRSNRLLADTEGAMGPAQDAGMLKQQMQDTAQRRSGPMYEAASRNAPQLPVTSNPAVYGPSGLNEVLAERLTAGNMSMGARNANRGVMDEIDDALAAGNPEVTARRLHDVRMRLDAQIVYDPRAKEALSSADKANQGALKETRAAVDDILKNRVPGFREADEVVARAKRMQDDVDYGQGALEGGKYATTPERFISDVSTRNLPAIGEGMKHDVRVSMGTQSNDLPALRKKVGGENDFNREKLSHVFGQPAVDRLTNAVGREQTFAQNYSDIARGSQTAQRRAASDTVAGTDPPRITGQETVTGMTLKGLGAMASSLLRRAHVASSQPARDALVRALLTKGADGEALMRAAQSARPLAGPAIRSVINALSATTNARIGAR